MKPFVARHVLWLVVTALICSVQVNGIVVPPTITSSPMNVTADRGDNVTFTCTVTSQATLTITWLSPEGNMLPETDQQMPNSSTFISFLSIVDVSGMDGGEYTCLASNGAGNASATAEIFVRPIILNQPMELFVSIGNVTSLLCDADGFPLFYQWQMLSSTLDGIFGSDGGSASGSGGSSSGSGIADNYVDIENATESFLEFDPIQFGDEGSYRCIAFNPVGTAVSEAATVTVSPEGSVEVSPLNETFNQGDNVTFNCSARGGPDNTFQWLRNGTELVNETSEMLFIPAITFMDGDDYTCMVSNAAGSENVSTLLFVSPEIVLNPMDMNTTNDSVIMIMCDVEAFPLPEFEWVHISGDIGSNIMGADTNMLVFNPVLFGDGGDYFCTATSNGISVSSDSATITVSPEGSVDASPPVINATRNTSVDFICSAMGGPDNTFTWTRLSDEQEVSDEQRLQILVMDAFDGSRYECLVENEAGNETTTVVLNVAVAIDTPPVDTNVTTTEEISLICTASGYPAPFISWTHNGTDIDNRTNITESNGPRFVMSTLTVSGAVINDSGEYVCNAANTFSTAVGGPVIVLVQDTPEQPQNVTGRALNSTAIQLNWFEPHDNNAPILGYRVMYTRPEFLKGSDVELSVLSEMAVVTGLHPGVTYNFTVIAFNDIGDSQKSAVAMVATEEEEPASPPQNVMASALSSTEITVTWEEVPMIDQNGNIINYEVQIEPLDFSADIMTNLLNTTNLSILVTGLEEFVNYSISVRAYTSVGPGPYSDPVTERTLEDVPATPPQNVNVTAISSTEIMVTWDEIPGLDQNGIIIDYEVQIESLDFPDDIVTDLLTTTNLSILVTGLEEFVNYNISVRAYTSVGPGPYSDPVTERTLEDVPATPPPNVRTFVISSTEILVFWSEVLELDRNGIIITYEVQLEPLDFTADIFVDSLNISDTEERATDLEEFVNYNISVRAYTSVGPGPYSDPVTARTLEDVPVAPPQNVQATAVSSTEIMVTWDEVPGLDQNGIIIDYEVQIEPLDIPADIVTDLLTTTNLSILVTGLEEFVNYNISVRAYTSVGPGPYSDPVTERTFENEPATPPQNVQAAAFNSTQITVTWEEVLAIDQNGDIVIYEVRFDPLQFTGVLMTEYINTTDMSAVLTSLQEFVDYNISVRAYTSVGPGPFSENVTERTFEDQPASPPQNIRTTAISSTEIDVRWNEVPAIDENGIIINYEVQVEPLDFNDILTIIYVNTTTLSTVVSDLQEFVAYNISVRAYTSVGPGPFSPPVTDRTLEDQPTNPPRNVQATALSSTEIMVTWERVSAINESGIITNYEVEVDPVDFTDILNITYVNTTNLSTVITGLQEHVEYDIRVRAYTVIGPGPFSPPETERTLEDVPATAPRNIEATAESSTEIMVTLEEVLAIDENGIIINYEVQFEPLEFTETLTTSFVNTTVLAVVLSSLQEYVEYNISVRAYTAIGFGPFSTEITERTFEDEPATPPQNVQTTVSSSTEIMVTWGKVAAIDENGIIINYEVQFVQLQFTDILELDSINTTDLTIVISGLQEYVEYDISVRAYTSVGPGPFSVAVTDRTFEDEPATSPRNVETFALSSTEIMVTWMEVDAIDENGIIINYEVQYQPLQFTNTLDTISINTTILSENITLLEEYVEYNISVRAYTSVGPGPYGDPVTERTLEDRPATPPQNVEAIARSSTEIMVTWEEVLPIDQNGIIIIYEIQYEPLQFNEALFVNTTDMAVNLTNLQEDVEYNISVRAYTSIGFGPFSTEITERTFEDEPASPPENVQTTVLSSTAIMVTWEEVPAIEENGIIINYEVEFEPLEFTDTLMINTTNGTNLSTVIAGLQEFVAYNISVRAYTSVGPGPFSVAVTNRTFEEEPATAPRNVTATAVSSNEIMVTWEEVLAIDENGIIINYEVQFEPLEFTETLTTSSVNTTNLTVVLSSLQENVEYNISVRAYTSVGPGPYSDPVTERTLEDRPATPPQNVEAIAISSTEIMVTWEEVLPIDQNGIITNYDVQYEPLQFMESLSTLVVTITDMAVNLTNLQEYVEYNISVRAYTAIGFGLFSTEITERTFEDEPATPPQNVQTTVDSSTEIMVTWEEVAAIDENGIIINYEVQFVPLQFTDNLELDSINTTDLMIVISGLQEYVEYDISVRAYTSVGPGPFSVAVTNRTFEDEPATSPQNIETVALSSNEIMVTWVEVDAIDENGIIINYELQYQPLQFTNTLDTISINTTNLTENITSLEEYVEYNISVRAYTSVGSGPYSDPVTERTLEDLPVAAPGNVVVENISANALAVSWDRPTEIDINGVLRFYFIEYWIVNQSDTQLTVNVTGDMLDTILNDLDNFTVYIVSVAAFTTGSGPANTSEERTSENVPGFPPQNVTARNESSTSISVDWEPPPQEFLYGIPRGYIIRYEGDEELNSTELISFNQTFFVLQNLSEFVNYSIEVTAVTGAGEGSYSPPVYVVTNQDLPGIVMTPLEVMPEDFASPFEATLQWMVPDDPNGEIISYNVDIGVISTNFSSASQQGRRKRQDAIIQEECILGTINSTVSVPGNQTSLTVTNLTPFTTYGFQVQAETSVGLGPFSVIQMFTTPEDAPTMPRNLQVQYINSTALEITWDHPLCDYGIRTNYTITHDPVEIDGVVGNLGSPFTLGNPDEISLTITELTINTNYIVMVYASTDGGEGNRATAINQTDEDAPQIVTGLSITSRENPDLRNNVFVEIEWFAPSSRNGSFNYLLNYTAEQSDPYPEIRMLTANNVTTIDGDLSQFIIPDGLPFANYTVDIYAFNIKRELPGPTESAMMRSEPTTSTVVTNLTAIPTSPTSIIVCWSFPIYPNGPIDHFELYFMENTVQQSSNDFRNRTIAGTQLEFNITGLVPFTYYAIHVQPFREDDSGTGGDVEMTIQRTNSTTPETPTEDPTQELTQAPSLNTISINLPPTSQLNTGPLMFYGIIVVDTRGVVFTNDPLQDPDPSNFADADPYDREANQQYYITAAWSDASMVPLDFIVGDETSTMVDGDVYFNARLGNDREYAIFVRIDIVSDNDQPLVVYSRYTIAKTDTPLNAVGLGVGLTFSILFITLIVVLIIIFICWYRSRHYKYVLEGELTLAEELQAQPLSVIGNQNIKAYAGTMDPVPVKLFGKHVNCMHSNDDYQFSEEYSIVEPNQAHSSETAHQPYNTSKNRYANIMAYDHSRVKLLELPGRQGSDYINANYMNGYNQQNAYIATQGPVPDSVPDFWRMVWEQGTATIVMLTNLEEKGRVKCHKYWPEEKNALYGDIHVHVQETLVLAEYTVRTFSLQKDGSKEERTVSQYHYTVWPDHGVPENPTPLLHFVRKVTTSNPINTGPMIVHCSAGVGRTGTFITLDTQLKRIEAEGDIDVFGFVRSMRVNRCCMVQTEPQYVFIHDALLEAIECGVTEVPARDLQEQYKRLGEEEVVTGKTGLELEFAKLNSTVHRRPRRDTGTLPINKPKNRFAGNPETIPFDTTRCRLSTIPGLQGSDYINASFVDGYHKRNTYIATQGPLPDTSEDFWRMVWENKCATIIMLTKEKEKGRVKCHRYWPESGAQIYGQFQVILHAVNEYSDYFVRDFKIVDVKDGSSLPVKQFQYTGWPEEGVPDSGSGLIDLIGQVQKWQMTSGDKPIVAHCSGGCGRTGTFIAVNILLERLKTEGVVDIFHTVRGLRQQRPGMVQNVDQYEFCYRTVLEYLDSFELYANFK